MSQMSQVDSGNTITESSRVRSRKWCFTLNNWTKEEYDTLLSQCHKHSYLYIIGKEIGGTLLRVECVPIHCGFHILNNNGNEEVVIDFPV